MQELPFSCLLKSQSDQNLRARVLVSIEQSRANRSNETVMSCRDQNLYAGTIHMPFGQWRVRGINMDVRRQPGLFGWFRRG